jgi:hypothetical protein
VNRSEGYARFRRILSLPRVPAKVGLPKRERLLSVLGGNGSSCPLRDLAGGLGSRPSWVGLSRWLGTRAVDDLDELRMASPGVETGPTVR